MPFWKYSAAVVSSEIAEPNTSRSDFSGIIQQIPYNPKLRICIMSLLAITLGLNGEYPGLVSSE